jgi:hypothetical protein
MDSSLHGNLFFLICRSELAPGGVPTMDVNDDEGCLKRGAFTSFASKLAPTGIGVDTPLPCATDLPLTRPLLWNTNL